MQQQQQHQQQCYQSQSHYAAVGARHHQQSQAAAAVAAAQPPPLLDQIANLLNLAQNLMSSVKERQHSYSQQASRAPAAERYTTRRNLRLQAAAPYQRLTSEAMRTLQASGVGVGVDSVQANLHSTSSGRTNTTTTTNANGNGNANANTNTNTNLLHFAGAGGSAGSAITNGGAQLNETQFCSCGECNARKVRSEIVIVGGGGSSGSGSGSGSANLNYMHCHNNGSNNNNNNNSSINNTNSRSYNVDCANNSKNNKNFQCSICLESYLLQRPMATLCGHIFCRLCILESLNRQGKCPICNRKLNLTNVFRVFF